MVYLNELPFEEQHGRKRTISASSESLDQIAIEEPSLKKKRKKNKKTRTEPTDTNANGIDTSAGLIEHAQELSPRCDVSEAEKKKKSKKVKQNPTENDIDAAAAVESLGHTAVQEQADDGEEQSQKKTKKNKKRNADKISESTSEASDTTDEQTEPDAPFRKNFYTMQAETEARSKSEVKEFYTEHNITLKGKGRKSFKPLIGFSELGFAADLMSSCGTFDRPTPIQSCCWPVAASGRDVIGIAETGSGKTLAFSLPALAHVRSRVTSGDFATSRPRGPFALVVAPTRELAMQSHQVLVAAGNKVALRCTALYGGVAKYPQKNELRRGVDIVVATPGRLVDLMNEGCCDLSSVSYLVLDEADRMLDAGFEQDMRRIISATHASRQTCLFSATWPDSIRALAHEFLSNPVRVTIGSEDLAAGSRITQIVEVLEDGARERRLDSLLKEYHSSRENRVLVFVLYKREAARIEQSLRRKGWNCGSIHGDKAQAQRTQALEAFRAGTVPMLVATDVAARGLDIPDVDYVINFSFPLTIEDYVHRIGRTGRAGKQGTAHTFFQPGADKSHAGELVNVLNDAGQVVPESMRQFNLTTKKKEHKLYGAFGPKDYQKPMAAPTRITFDDE